MNHSIRNSINDWELLTANLQNLSENKYEVAVLPVGATEAHNRHGGNDFVPLIRQIQTQMDTFVFLCDWWKVGEDHYDEIFENPDDHAGEMETSVALALFPELVQLTNAGSGKVRSFRFEALRKGWLRTSRDFAKINDHCAAGDPSKASADKGRQYLDLVVGRISDFLVELAQSSIDEDFPFKG